MDSTNSAFKVPMAPQPRPSQSETLLFNDIFEEKALALRNFMNDFLQVQPFRRFENEFSNFLKHGKQIIQESHRAGANVSRLTNSSQMAPMFARPSASFNYRPSTTLSMVSSNRNSALEYPENNFQPIESSNPFKPPVNMNLQPRVLLPRIEQSMYATRNSPALCATVIEVNQNERSKTNNDENCQPCEPVERPHSPVPNSYSDVTITENISVASSQQNEMENDGSNSIESLLNEVGFKIVLGLPENKDNSNSPNNSKQRQSNQLNKEKNAINEAVKYLSKWSLNMKNLKLQKMSSKFVVILTGTLLGDDQVTVVEKCHDAGILEGRKENNLVKTKNGVYKLIGNIIGGSPNELYHACLSIKGIPRYWRNIVKQSSGVNKGRKNDLLNFSLDSPAGPSTQKNVVAVNNNMTRKGTTNSKHISHPSQMTFGKRKFSEDTTESSNTKHHKLHELPPLLASTPKRPRKDITMFASPSEMIKNKLHQSIREKTDAKINGRTLNTINDSINVTKKRQSFSKEQKSKLLKTEVPIETSLSSINSTKNSKPVPRNSIEGCSSGAKESKQTSINNLITLNSVNNSTSRSNSKTTQNSSAAKKSVNSSASVSKSKTTPNSSAGKKSVNSSASVTKSKTTPNSSARKISVNSSASVTKSKTTPNSSAGKKSVNSSASVTKTKTARKSSTKKDSVNSNASGSKSKTTRKSSAIKKSLNSSKEQSKHKSPLKSTKNSTNNSESKSKKITLKNVKPKKSVKGSKKTKQKESRTPSPKIVPNKIRNSCLKSKTNDSSQRLDAKRPNEEDTKKSKTNNKRLQDPRTSTDGLFDGIDVAAYGDVSDYNIMASPGKLSVLSHTDKSRCETPPLFGNQWGSSTKSVAVSEPPTPLSKSAEAKALKRVKAPKLTMSEEIKHNKENKKMKQSIDFKTVSNQINQMLEFGE